VGLGLATKFVWKKRSGVIFPILKKQHVLRDNNKVLIPQFLVTCKHVKVFEIVVFEETIVLLKYLTNTPLLTNRVLGLAW
jgi:hypothetical protein